MTKFNAKKAMMFDRMAEIWTSVTESRVAYRRAFVVQTKLDAVLVEGVDVEDPFRPTVVGRGKTVGWAYIECPNGERMVAKFRETTTDDRVTEVLSRLADIAMS